MRIVTVAGLAGLALISLSACNRNTQSSSAASASGATAGSAPATSASLAPGQMPHYREGLWQMAMTSEGRGATMVSKMCLDKTVEDKMAGFSASIDRSKCSTYNVTHQLNGDWTVATVCDRGALGKVSSNGTVHGDFDNGYHMESVSTTTGATMAQMNGEHKIVMDSKWLGPCGPDMKPGDVIVNGMKVNVINPGTPTKAPS